MELCSASFAIWQSSTGKLAKHLVLPHDIDFWKIELRYVKRNYHLRLNDKVSVVTKNAMPFHKLPCLSISDEMMEMVS